jgi:hypothetical protein
MTTAHDLVPLEALLVLNDHHLRVFNAAMVALAITPYPEGVVYDRRTVGVVRGAVSAEMRRRGFYSADPNNPV